MEDGEYRERFGHGAVPAGMIPTEIIADDEICGDNGGVKNDVEDGGEGDDVVEFIDLDVVDCCVKQENACNGN